MKFISANTTPGGPVTVTVQAETEEEFVQLLQRCGYGHVSSTPPVVPNPPSVCSTQPKEDKRLHPLPKTQVAGEQDRCMAAVRELLAEHPMRLPQMYSRIKPIIGYETFKYWVRSMPDVHNEIGKHYYRLADHEYGTEEVQATAETFPEKEETPAPQGMVAEEQPAARERTDAPSSRPLWKDGEPIPKGPDGKRYKTQKVRNQYIVAPAAREPL